jgi:hypothetical protein
MKEMSLDAGGLLLPAYLGTKVRQAAGGRQGNKSLGVAGTRWSVRTRQERMTESGALYVHYGVVLFEFPGGGTHHLPRHLAVL